MAHRDGQGAQERTALHKGGQGRAQQVDQAHSRHGEREGQRATQPDPYPSAAGEQERAEQRGQVESRAPERQRRRARRARWYSQRGEDQGENSLDRADALRRDAHDPEQTRDREARQHDAQRGARSERPEERPEAGDVGDVRRQRQSGGTDQAAGPGQSDPRRRRQLPEIRLGAGDAHQQRAQPRGRPARERERAQPAAEHGDQAQRARDLPAA